MKKYTFQTLSIVLLTALTMMACKKTKTPDPKNPEPIKITMADVSNNYFIFEKNVGKALLVAYFVDEGGTKKFYFDGRAYRRIGVPTISAMDSVNGTATLNLDINGDGTTVITYALKKSATGTMTLTGTTYNGATTAIVGSNMYKVADLSGLNFSGLTFNRNYNDAGTDYRIKCEFSATMLKLNHTNLTTSSVLDAFNKPYYALTYNVGAKVDPDFIILAHKNIDGTYGYQMDNGGLVASF